MYQIARIQNFSKGSLKNVLNELDRTDGEFKNVGRDEKLAYLNHSYKDLRSGGEYATFDQILKECKCKPFVDKKGVTAFEGIMVTASPELFEQLGWVKGKPAPKAIEQYFDEAYALVCELIGFRGTDVNILSAKVHYDETTPHLQVDYIPIVENYQKKVYEKDENGKVKRNERGTPIQAKDENGKTIFEEVKGEPKVSRADFWRERGGKNSYSLLQDTFYEKLGKQYGLERGKAGSNAKHKTNHQYHKEQADKELRQTQEQVLEYDLSSPKKLTESKGAYEERVKTHQQAVAVKQRNKQLDEREKALDKREKQLDIEADTRAKRLKLQQYEDIIDNYRTEINKARQERADALEKAAATDRQNRKIIAENKFLKQEVEQLNFELTGEALSYEEIHSKDKRDKRGYER